VNLLADESLDEEIVYQLRHDGHLVWYVAEMEPGIADDLVLELANRECAVLLTADKDFGELVFRLNRVASGVVLVRLSGLSLDRKAEIVSQVVNQYARDLPGAFTVITPLMVRIRRLES
jgi:predicted nuclease of predicted toxin-antitoxin system